MQADKILNRTTRIISRIEGAKQLILSEKIGFDMEKIKPLFGKLTSEIKDQSDNLYKEASKPKPPRKAGDLLQEIADKKQITPELLKEIEQLINAKDVKVKTR